MMSYLIMAGKIALPNNEAKDVRNFWIGCVGIREDGTLVSAKNGAAEFSSSVKKCHLLPNSHAEGRVLRKLGRNGTLYVSRVNKTNNDFAMALPCGMCQTRIRAFKVKKVYYSINESQYGVWNVASDSHHVFLL